MEERITPSAAGFVNELQKDIQYLEPIFSHGNALTDRECMLWEKTASNYHTLDIDASLPGNQHARHLRNILLNWLARMFSTVPEKPHTFAAILQSSAETLKTIQQCLSLQEGDENDNGSTVEYFDIRDMQPKHVGVQRAGGTWTQAAGIDIQAYGQHAISAKNIRDCLHMGNGRMLLRENSGHMIGYYLYNREQGCIYIHHAALMPTYLTTGIREILAMDIVSQSMKGRGIPQTATFMESRQKDANPPS